MPPVVQKTGWTGAIELQDAKLTLPGVADPVAVESASAHIEGARVILDRIHAQAGKIAFQGDYRYEPQVARPHRLRLKIAEADAAELERLLMPTLRHSRGLIERALSLGSAPPPAWFSDRHVDAVLQVAALHFEGADLTALQTHLLWDVTKAEFTDLHATLNGGRVTGSLSVSLSPSRPTYRLIAHAKGCEWRSGKIDADTTLESSGTGVELITRLRSTGAFTARGLAVEDLPALASVAGTYTLAWTRTNPLLHFTDLQVISGDETYTGQGATQPDGRLLFVLSNGTKEMRMSGTLAQLRLVDQPESR